MKKRWLDVEDGGMNTRPYFEPAGRFHRMRGVSVLKLLLLIPLALVLILILGTSS